MYRAKNLYESHGKALGLELIAGKNGLRRVIKIPESHRPGLSLTGFLKGHDFRPLLIFGKLEINYLKDVQTEVCIKRLEGILSNQTPAVFVADRVKSPYELIQLCDEKNIPLFRTSMNSIQLSSKLTYFLLDEFAPTMTCHGCLVEVFGVGVMIQGESAVGKSEAALGLIERGHRLISDDVVIVKLKEGSYLEGTGMVLSKHHMEVRGIGIINIEKLYGPFCVREKKELDLVVKLVIWNDSDFYDRVGLEENTTSLLGFSLPFHILPVKPGRDVVLLLETLAMDYQLKKQGYYSACEFNRKLLAAIVRKKGKKPRERQHVK